MISNCLYMTVYLSKIFKISLKKAIIITFGIYVILKMTWETFPSNKIDQSYSYGYKSKLVKSYYYLPLGKGCSPTFEQTWIPFTHARMLFAKFGWNFMAYSGSEEEEDVKSLQTDGRQTTGDQKSSLELSAQWAKTHGW